MREQPLLMRFLDFERSPWKVIIFITQFLKIQSVHTFHASKIFHHNHFEKFGLENDPTQFKTLKLNLRVARFGSTSFFHFIGRSKKLRHFSFEHYSSEDELVREHSELVMRVLSNSHTTLETLQIKECGDSFSRFVVGSLVKFQKLRSATVDVLALGSAFFDNCSDILAEEILGPYDYFKDLSRSIESLTLTGGASGSHLEGLTEMLNSITSFKFLDHDWGKTVFPDKTSPEVPDYHDGFTAGGAELIGFMPACWCGNEAKQFDSKDQVCFLV